MKCVFCSANLKNDIIFETEHFLFIRDKFPIVKGHALLIPKVHIRKESELVKTEWFEYMEASRRAYRYIQSRFRHAPLVVVNPPQQQSVGHLHKHFIPGVFGVLGPDRALRAYLLAQKKK